MSAARAAGLVAVLAVLAGSRVAAANPCVVDDDCSASRLGNGNQGRLYRPLLMRFEMVALGGTLVLAQDDVIDASLGRFTSDGRAEARGGSGRLLMGYGNLYAGFDMGALGWRKGPDVRLADGSTPFDSTSAPTTSSGTAMFGSFFVGAQHTAGRLIVAGELGVGFNLGWNDSGTLEDSEPAVTFVRVALPARVRAGVWLTRHVSLLGSLGTDLANRGGHEVGVALGFSLGAWDGQR